MIVAIVGPHGVGKTTVGRLVARRLGWRWDPEIGLQLRREALERDPSATADRPQPGFDQEVFRRELLRDAQSRGVHRVVETWHPGNLAYARQRNPELADTWERCLAAAARSAGAVVLPLVCDRAVLAARRSEPGGPDIVDFFLRVGEEARAIARDWGLVVLHPLDTSRLRPPDLAAQVAEAIRLVAAC